MKDEKTRIICDAVKLGSYEEVDGIPAKNITRIDGDDTPLSGLIIRGYETKFNTERNENGEIFTKDCLDDFVERYYVKKKLNLPLDIQHRNDLLHLAGRVLVLEVNSVGFYFVCYVPRALPEYDRIKTLVQEGILQGLSKFGWATQGHWDEDKQAFIVERMDILSVSLVCNPANGVAFEKVQEVKNGLAFRKVEVEDKGCDKKKKKSMFN